MEVVGFDGNPFSTCSSDFLGADGFLSALTHWIHKKDWLDVNLEGANGAGVRVGG